MAIRINHLVDKHRDAFRSPQGQDRQTARDSSGVGASRGVARDTRACVARVQRIATLTPSLELSPPIVPRPAPC